jgi:lipoprotein-anchoring transpeptidase ErfK/SrfK
MFMVLEESKRATTPIAVIVLMAIFAVVSVAAIVGDYATLPIVTKGVTLAGHDLSGMNPTQVRSTIEDAVTSPAMQPIKVLGTTTSWSLDPKGIVTVDADAIVHEAYAPARNASLVTRLYSRIANQPLPAEIKPVYAVATSTLSAWVAEAAAVVDTKPVDATRTIVNYTIKIKPEIYGATVDQPTAVSVLAKALTDDALTSESRTTSLPVEVVAPHVLKSSFKTAIVVSIRLRRVHLYHGDVLVKTYPCAPGQIQYPTPLGDFKVIRKQKNAPWINPGSAWAASMPHSIPGGPGNPMGDRKIGINYPGVFLHGIPPSEYSSIGTRASHGCMRMMPSAIHDLFPRVKIGDPVFIRS